MKRVIIRFGLLTALAFFSTLMVRITVPYLTFEPSVRFLQIKQWVIQNDVWRFAFFTHVVSSVFLLGAGFTQFYSPFKKFNTLHRNFGKLYVVIIVFISGPAGLIMSWYANGGWSSQIAFTLLSVFWIYVTLRAWLEVKRRNYESHGEYMIRSYALTLSAITLRSWKYLIVLAFHPHPMDGYRIVAWLGWVPNFLLAEWLIRKHYSRRILQAN